MTPISEPVAEFLLAIADDKHLMGQQHAEWIGVAPFLEEDLAFCSIGQDELGHAALLYGLLAGDDDITIDRLAYGRHDAQYRSCWLAEHTGGQPDGSSDAGDWAEALVRHWMFDTADSLRWSLAADSSLVLLRRIAERVAFEESYHRRHANDLLDALLADADAGSRLRNAAQRLAPLALGLFEGVAGEAEAVAAGVAQAPFSTCRDQWMGLAEDRFGPIRWGTAPDQQARTARSTDFAPLMARMREVLDFDPDATW